MWNLQMFLIGATLGITAILSGPSNCVYSDGTVKVNNNGTYILVDI